MTIEEQKKINACFRQKRYYEKHKKELYAKKLARLKANPEIKKMRDKRYYDKNREEIRERRNKARFENRDNQRLMDNKYTSELRDSYIKKRLKEENIIITPKTIVSKRISIMISRSKKNNYSDLDITKLRELSNQLLGVQNGNQL